MYLFGLSISSDYGISWDENARRVGAKSHAKELVQFLGLNYSILDKIPAVKDNYHAHAGPYGMIYEFPALIYEIINGKEKTKETFLFRHKLIFTFHFIGIITFFLFSREIFFSKYKAIIATLIFSLHPRIFAHSFFNPKDIIFLSLITMSLFPIARYINTQKNSWIILASLFVGFAMSMRIVGIYVSFLIIILLSAMSYSNNTIKDKKKSYPIIIGFITLAIPIITTYILTPYFWESPIERFTEAYLRASKYPWAGYVFYFGEIIKAKSIPWHYIIIWIGITTPISYIVFFFMGIIKILRNYKFEFFQNPMMIFCFFGFLIPVSMAIILNSVLYDGWRHFFFIYPFLAIFISYGLFEILEINILRNKIYLQSIIVLLLFFGALTNIIKMHPFQQVYFNNLAGSDPIMKFEGDYYGTSYRNALDYILENDTSNKIYIDVQNDPGAINRHIISENNKKRLVYDFMPEWNDDPDYFITNYRTDDRINTLNDVRAKIAPYNNEYYSISVNGMKILGVYKK